MKQLINNVHLVQGLQPVAVTSVTPDYISMKNYGHLTIVVMLAISSGTDDGALAILQATAVAGTSAKAIPNLDVVWKNLDTATEQFTKDTTSCVNGAIDIGGVAKNLIYVFEIDKRDLDVDNSFDCVGCTLADVTNGTASILYVLSEPKWIDENATKPISIAD